MERIPVWLLPAVLALLQLAAWPGLPYLNDESVPALSSATAVAVTVTVAVALVWRRTAPVATTVVVVAALTVAELGLPPDTLTAITVGDIVLLYGLAVRRSQRTAVVAAAVLTVWQSALAALDPALREDYAASVVFLVVFYVAVVALGRARHHWYADRAQSAARLAEAEERRLRAADTERHRLARELHDVTAHHLTSIVVIASAAQRVGGTRPELVAEAREFAASTGRETLGALHRLVALLQQPGAAPGAERLTELADGFRRLGQHVTLEGTASMTPAVADAAYGIAREALTNTLRYAPGSAVTVRVADTPAGVELSVGDDGTAAAREQPAARLGSGRGIAGMRERAAALGGTLEAGPRPGGGWRVRAVLPASEAPAVSARWRPGAETVIDAAVLLLALVIPAVALLVEMGGSLPPSVASLAALTVIGHALPLAWRRTRPWTVLAAVLATGWVWPLLIAVQVLTITHGWLVLTGLGVEVLAVHAVARHGRRPGLTWLAMPAVLASVVPAITLMLVLDPPRDMQSDAVVAGAVLALLGGVPLAFPVFGAWLAGFVVRRRRDRAQAHEDYAVASATAWALAEAGAERARVAAGLREAVLRDTARVADAADRGDLDEVLSAARTALDTMRGLLKDLRDAPAGEAGDGARAPQPTLEALPALADRWRSGGRTVDLEVAAGGRRLSTDVDVSAYRVVELLLAGDTGPVRVRVDATGDPLRIAVTPMPDDPGGEVAAGLRARLAAVGGTQAVTADGTSEIRLPAPPGAPPAPALVQDAPEPGTEDEGVATSPRV